MSKRASLLVLAVVLLVVTSIVLVDRDGALAQIPFSVLVTQPYDGDPGAAPWLIRLQGPELAFLFPLSGVLPYM